MHLFIHLLPDILVHFSLEIVLVFIVVFVNVLIIFVIVYSDLCFIFRFCPFVLVLPEHEIVNRVVLELLENQCDLLLAEFSGLCARFRSKP
jgi:hypothetical protein